MDFEMEIPAAEELEWLESNSLLPEFEEEEDEEEEECIVVEDEQHGSGSKERNLSRIQDPTASQENQIHRKRIRSEENGDAGASRNPIPADAGEGERGVKRRELLDDNDEGDEDWLRYSPPLKEVATDFDQPVSSDAAEEKEQIISRFASEIEGDCIPVTGPSGDRVYAKMSSGVMDGGRRKFHMEKSANGLLSEPIHTLINGVEQEVLNKALLESSGSPRQTIHSATPLVTEQLWVDKYAPNSFTELLSDEQTNREVLLWLKQWDSCVFGSQIRATTDDVFSALKRHSSAQNQKVSDNKSFFTKNGATASMSQNPKLSNVRDTEYINLNGVSELWSKKHSLDCHPEQKVLLLCGSPGLGKTTLAHVAAKHCGYRVVEINASDERSSSTIESKILDVVQMNSVMADSKPKCLVIDEIDGALGEGKGAVEVILKMVTAERKSSVDKENSPQELQSGKAPLKKAKKRNTATLLRPVICICNDLYAPALRSLRQVAKVHMFVQPTISRVVNRLKYICKREGFQASSIALSALAEFTECDIRSCLNTLQFLNKKKEALNFLELGSQVVGRKDMSRSAFDVWKEIFQKRKCKRGRNAISDSRDHGDFDFLYSLISNRGEYELTMDGIHENFLRLSYHDPMMQKTVRCLDTLGVSDSLLKYILRTQRMSLYAYQPPIVIITRNLIAQFEKPNIEWPKSFQKCRARLRERRDSIKIWHNKISPSLSRHLSIEYFVGDLISPLLHILSPPTLRPVALHLLTDREKNDLAQLVDTMASYSITYKFSKQEPVQKIHHYGAASEASELSFDPPIDEFIRFQDYQSEHIGLSSAMKQVLVHEVEKQRILRESIGKSTNHVEESNSTKQDSPCANKTRTADLSVYTAAEGSSQLKMAHSAGQNIASKSSNSFSESRSKNLLANGVPSKAQEGVKKHIRTSSSFFDSFRKGSGKDSKSPGEILQKAATTERDSRPLFFKYNEGFTNAVKRPVKIRELLF